MTNVFQCNIFQTSMSYNWPTNINVLMVWHINAFKSNTDICIVTKLGTHVQSPVKTQHMQAHSDWPHGGATTGTCLYLLICLTQCLNCKPLWLLCCCASYLRSGLWFLGFLCDVKILLILGPTSFAIQRLFNGAVGKNTFTSKATDGETENFVIRWLELAPDRDGGRDKDTFTEHSEVFLHFLTLQPYSKMDTNCTNFLINLHTILQNDKVKTAF